MMDPDAVAEQLEQTFNKIHLENMQGIPILNSAIRIQALGFQLFQGRVIGIIITPWLMNVVILPTDDEDWSHMNLGDKRPHKFSSRTYKFMLNEFDGIGLCQTHSLYSPMQSFASHEQALDTAQSFLDDLMVERDLTEEERVDEELLGRVLRGEAIPEVNFDAIDSAQTDQAPAEGQEETSVNAQKDISRRNLLRGQLS